MATNYAFQVVPELVAALEMLVPEKCAKMIAFLKSRACRRVRTKNHVERVNRALRHQEKARWLMSGNWWSNRGLYRRAGELL